MEATLPLGLTHVKVDQIIIGERFRKDLGDIARLAAEIADVGLLHPIAVRPNYELLAGRRRLAAYEHLERATIPAWVLDHDNPLKAEFAENEHRKALTPSERVAIVHVLEAKLAEEAKERQRQAGRAVGRGNTTHGAETGADASTEGPQEACENFTQASTGHPRTRDAAAAAVGWSGPTYAEAKAVVKAAQDDPALQPLVELMDDTGKVAEAYRRLPDTLKPAPRPTRTKEERAQAKEERAQAKEERQAEKERQKQAWSLEAVLGALEVICEWPMDEDDGWYIAGAVVPEDDPQVYAKAEALVQAVLPIDEEAINYRMQAARVAFAALVAAWTARMQAAEAGA
jgi:ParB family chromosome partitioning protein